MSDSTLAQEQLTQDIADTPSRNPFVRWFGSHPTGFWFFFWGEFAERCSFYGMKAILAKYMADQLTLGQDNAATYVSFFIAACYFLPLLGGWVADRFFGKYWTIVGFSLPYILGHVILGVEDIYYMVAALTLLAMGSGVIKPNISTLMGLTYDQQRPGQPKLRSDAFAMFYFAINIGAGISQFAMPPIRTKWGYAIAFLFPAALMVIAFIIFALGKKYYAVETVERKTSTPEERRERWRVIGRVAGLFFLVMFFWAIFDQSGSTWIFFAEACMDLHVFGVKFDPDQFQAFNPIFILILLPPITLFVKYLQDKGWKVLPTSKLLVGFLVAAVCMGIMALSAVLAGSADLRPGIAKGDDLKITLTSDVTRNNLNALATLVLQQQPMTAATNSSYSLTVRKPEVIEGKLIIKEVIEGKLTIKIAGDDAVTVQRETKVKKDGKNKIVKENWKLTGKGVVKLVATESNDKVVAITVDGVLTQFDKVNDDETTETLLEGDLTASASGEIGIDKRWYVEPDKKVTVWWQVLAYFLITVAEVLISVTGLELGYTAAPKSMSGFVTGMWLVTVGMGNLFINAPVTRLYTSMQPAAYFGMLTILLVIVAVAFMPVARRFNRPQPDQTPTAE